MENIFSLCLHVSARCCFCFTEIPKHGQSSCHPFLRAASAKNLRGDYEASSPRKSFSHFAIKQRQVCVLKHILKEEGCYHEVTAQMFLLLTRATTSCFVLQDLGLPWVRNLEHFFGCPLPILCSILLATCRFWLRAWLLNPASRGISTPHLCSKLVAEAV